MPSHPFSAPLTPPSSSSPAFRLPTSIPSTKRRSCPVNFSHPFNTFNSSPFVIPDFTLSRRSVSSESESSIESDDQSMTKAGTKSKPSRKAFDYDEQRYPHPARTLPLRTSDEFVQRSSPSGSVFDSRPIAPKPVTFLGRAMTTTMSQDEATKSKIEGKIRAQADAAATGTSSRGLTALPTFSNSKIATLATSDHSSAKNSTESAATSKSSTEKPKPNGNEPDTRKKRNSLITLGRSLSFNMPIGRKRSDQQQATTLSPEEKSKRRRSDMDILDCFKDNSSLHDGMLSDTPGNPSNSNDISAHRPSEEQGHISNRDSSCLAPHHLSCTATPDISTIHIPTADSPHLTKTKPRPWSLRPNSTTTTNPQTWSTRKLQKQARAKKLDKMAFEILRLNGEIERMYAGFDNMTFQLTKGSREMERLKGENEQLRNDWYDAEARLTEERYKHWELRCKWDAKVGRGNRGGEERERLLEGGVRSRPRPAQGGRQHRSDQKEGRVTDDGDVGAINAFLRQNKEPETLRPVAAARRPVAPATAIQNRRPDSWVTEADRRASAVRDSWVTEAAVPLINASSRTEQVGDTSGVRESWLTVDTMDAEEGGNGDGGAVGMPYAYRTRTTGEVLREA